MKMNIYQPFFSPRQMKMCPGVKAGDIDPEGFMTLADSAKVKDLIKRYREGDESGKRSLPAVCWTGYTKAGERRLTENMVPTQLFMIDIDHCENPLQAWETIKERIAKLPNGQIILDSLVIVHITPSGKGLRLVFRCTQHFSTLEEHMKWLNGLLGFADFGKFDTSVKDISRISFVPQKEDILYVNWEAADSGKLINCIQNEQHTDKDIRNDGAAGTPSKSSKGSNAAAAAALAQPWRSQFVNETYRGHKLTDIMDRYVECYGKPGKGEKHNYYNRMVKDFRDICDNDPHILYDLLPRFNGDDVFSQCESICRVNNNTTVPDPFLTFLVENGFYEYKDNGNDNGNGNGDQRPLTPSSLRGGVDNGNGDQRPLTPSSLRGGVDNGNGDGDDNGNGKRSKSKRKAVDPVDKMPPAPPVIRELLSIAPKDFIKPCINGLLPILGTLTSYVRAEDTSNGKTISTTFFSIVYAPPSSGKSFIERYINLLLRDIFLRDEVNNARDALYARMANMRNQNEKGEPLPETSVRIMEAKSSESEFLEKQRNNHGHHMFTYCAEIDQWKKGVKAAGGNKDDMIRIAWDNGTYGQNFKSTNTFKGRVPLYWNVLICGTEDQLMTYFRNVTNGLVTRCSFAKVENQEFREQPPEWKKFSKQALKVINDFIDRCDAQTYATPLEYDVSNVWQVEDEAFDKEVPWKMNFKPLQQVDISWLNPTVRKFHKEQTREAIRAYDVARDIFRRRVADRGRRLALICTQLYGRKMTKQDKAACAKWIYWWMTQDIEAIIKPFGEKYVRQANEANIEDKPMNNLFDRLGTDFTRDDVDRIKRILGYTTDSEKIISMWKSSGFVTKEGKNMFKKVLTNKK